MKCFQYIYYMENLVTNQPLNLVFEDKNKSPLRDAWLWDIVLTTGGGGGGPKPNLSYICECNSMSQNLHFFWKAYPLYSEPLREDCQIDWFSILSLCVFPDVLNRSGEDCLMRKQTFASARLFNSRSWKIKLIRIERVEKAISTTWTGLCTCNIE